MSAVKIAVGVFLGNLAFALLAWLVFAMVVDRQTAAYNARIAHERLEALQHR